MFDTEFEENKVLCSLPMGLFGYANVEVEIVCGDQCILNTNADIPIKGITSGPLEDTTSLYELVGRFYILLGINHSSEKLIRVRDFTFPPFDQRHWGIVQQMDQDESALIAQYDFEGNPGEDSLGFKKGDTFEFIEDRGHGWLRVRTKDGSQTVGLVPSNYVNTK